MGYTLPFQRFLSSEEPNLFNLLVQMEMETPYPPEGWEKIDVVKHLNPKTSQCTMKIYDRSETYLLEINYE